MRVNFSNMPDYTRQQEAIAEIVQLENYIVSNMILDRAPMATDAAEREQDVLLEELYDSLGDEDYKRFVMSMTQRSMSKILERT